MKYFFFLLLLLYCFSLTAQPANKVATGYAIYILANKIGTENCRVSDSSHSVIYSIDDAFNDRGAKRKLSSRIAINNNNSALYLNMSGFTSRWQQININLQIPASTDSIYFPVVSAVPATLQQLLITFWQQHNRPQIITTLPNHQLIYITEAGLDTVTFKGNVMVLQRLMIKGLIRGNEFAWLTNSSELVFLSTNDSEGDKTEIINNGYEALFNALLSLANVYAIAEAVKEYPAIKNMHDYTAITHGTLINVTGKDSVTENALVLVHNGNIEYAGKMDTAKIPAGSNIVNATGKYLLPGLWDMHAHLMQAEWLPEYIKQGVTTVRDCGNEFQFINTLAQLTSKGLMEGSQIIKAGLIDGSGSNALGAMQAASKDKAIKLVHLYKDSGFAQVKIYSSVKQSLIKIICSAAHNAGLTVTGHIPDGVTATAAIEDGMDMVSHVSFFRNTMFTRGNEIYYSDKRTASFVQLLSHKKIVLDPTLSVFETADSAYQKNIPFYKTVTYQLYKAGVPVVAGTDMSEGGIAHELELYVACGFTPLQAIQAATIAPARVMKMDALQGSIEAGKQADIIILKANPVVDIKNIAAIETVMINSCVYSLQ